MSYEFEYAKTLEEAGFSDKEAEATIKTVLDIMEEKVASKLDLERAEFNIRSEMKDLKLEIKDVSSDIKLMESKIVNKLIGFLALGFTVLGYLQYKF